MAIEYPRRRPPLHNEPLDMDGHDANSDHYQSDNDDDTNSDTSDAVVEVSADEFPGYFQERDGRLFHSHGRSPYPLPVDAEEHEVSPAEGPGGHTELRPAIFVASLLVRDHPSLAVADMVLFRDKTG